MGWIKAPIRNGVGSNPTVVISEVKKSSMTKHVVSEVKQSSITEHFMN